MTSRQDIETLIARYNTLNVRNGIGGSLAYMTVDREGRMDGVVYSGMRVDPVSAAEFFRRYLAA